MNNKKKPNSKEFSEENKNLEVVSSGNEAHGLLVQNKADEEVELAGGKLNVRKGGSLIIGTLNIMVDPVKKHLKHRHEKFYKNSQFHLWADVGFALAIICLVAASIYFFNVQPKAQIDLSSSLSEESAVSGQAETLAIGYKNNGKVDIANSTLSFAFPKNFVLLAVSPEKDWSDQTNTFQIGDLPRGANGQVKITGIAYGSIGSRQTLNYSLNYLQNNQKRNTLGSFPISFGSSVLEASFDAPKTVFRDIDFSGNIILKNNGRADIQKEIDLDFGTTSVKIVSISSDKAILANGEIIVNELKAGEAVNIEYEAVTNSAEGLEAELSTYINIDGQKEKQAKAAKNLSVSVPKFEVDISVEKQTMASGGIANFKLKFANREDSDISNLFINLMSSDNAIAFDGLKMADGSDKYQVSGNSIELGALKAGATGEINFSAMLRRRMNNVNQMAGVVANVNYKAGDKQVEYKFFSPKIKLLSDLQIVSKGLYYGAQGDQLGVGPLPPVVDVPTKYWVFWEINNAGNELKDLTVTAEMPTNVGWTNQKTVLAGDLRYGEISRKVVWTVNEVAPQNGNYRAGFEVALIPTAADFGAIPDLINNIKYSATDIFANQDISGSLPTINANLKDDPIASGKGKVIELKIVK
jgi:hypothetical protein